jgi:hypothetical protein
MQGTRQVNGYQARVAVASAEEDPNVSVVSGSSPPCFLHELDPSFLGYLSRDEVVALLHNLLAAEWAGTTLERAWLRAMLRRQIEHIGGRCETSSPPGDPAVIDDGGSRADLGRLTGELRQALPRIYDEVLRRDLEQVMARLDRDVRRCVVRAIGGH